LQKGVNIRRVKESDETPAENDGRSRSDQGETTRTRRSRAPRADSSESIAEQVRQAVLGIQTRPLLTEQVRQAVLGIQTRPLLTEQVRQAVLGIQTRPLLTEQLRRLVQESLRRATLPSNLETLPKVTSDDVLAFTLEHGVSLYLVPRESIASSMLAAPDKAAVRKILGDMRIDILDDCRAVLQRCDAADTLAYRELALQAVSALDADLFGPAQALAANLLDVLINEHLEPDLKRAAKRQPGESIAVVKSRIADLDAWQGYVASALWSTFQHYFRDRGDAVPQAFSRHATAHAPGRRQYSRRSAVQGLMAVTGAIGYLNGLN